MAKERIYVKPRQRDPAKPAAGVLQVRRENGTPIPDEGAWVEPSQYIRRRLRDGDLVTATARKRRVPKPPPNPLTPRSKP
ncbi:DUF2635 domain-containing protein [Marinobacter subterrani]|uniref:DUF2635 domain-containing protein n=1 Tax=Marinobacter subterrani TaxID=1658765 RepID=A0A0J7J793_9GAMM|nr:DUF2635 domain-containing protein [Marinobacter subterrani]KMQ73844.1 Protein of unknown function (DUF2635) [Marinobacter subterrani]